ncbi:gamma-glutamylcyclotransferase [Roseiconus nitratireducens]|nr:gamma-glutamylcyclotransferase [Roseiconus nitratireducens]
MSISASYYFAYGSNLDTADFDRWCGEKGYGTGLLRKRSWAQLFDHRLAFSHFSCTRGGGALNVEPYPGGMVEGVLFEVDPREGWEALDRKEGAPRYYQRVPLAVVDQDGEEIEAITYLVKQPKHRHVKPTDAYLQLVQNAYENHDLELDILNAAAAGHSEPITDAIFIYGTLMRGQCRAAHIREHGVQYVCGAACPGSLWDTGSGFPGITFDSEHTYAHECVRGEYLRTKNLPALLERLDRIEGFRGFGKGGSLFHRRLTTVEVGGKKLRPAWVYVLANARLKSERIPSGCWRTHYGLAQSHFDHLLKVYARCEGKAAELLQIMCRLNPWLNLEQDSFGMNTLKELLLDGTITEFEMVRAAGRRPRLW